ncbi:MAG: hypothetical protein LBU14_03175 [Candidatus Peribacteria bacterium]|jgi:hypothetical protein|nr:hypothetical protein [Candidatus Peribacteria bacterium]
MSSKNLRIKTRKLLYQELFANTFQVVNEITFYASFFDDKYNFEKDDKYLKKMKQIIKENE